MLNEFQSIKYKTFAKLLYYPDSELAKFLYNNVITDFLSELEIDSEVLQNLKTWLVSFKNKDELLEAIQVEYTNLFITSFPSVPAHMFKSYYYEKEILGNSTEKIMDIYEKYGFHVSDNMNEPADNLAIMLEFVYRLSEMENTYDEQIDFIQNEILSWVDKLERSIVKFAKAPFYPYIINAIINDLKNDVTQHEIKLAGAKI